MKKYKLQFILKRKNGTVSEWHEEVIPGSLDDQKNEVALSLPDYMHLRGYEFYDGGWQLEKDGNLWRAVDAEGYPTIVE